MMLFTAAVFFVKSCFLKLLKMNKSAVEIKIRLQRINIYENLCVMCCVFPENRLSPSLIGIEKKYVMNFSVSENNASHIAKLSNENIAPAIIRTISFLRNSHINTGEST